MNNVPNTKLIINHLREKLSHDLEKYLTDDYDAVALHSSSILIAANQAALDMFGYTEEELIGMNAWHFFHSKSAPVIMQHLMDKSTEPYQVVAVKKDKTEFDIEIKGMDFEVDGESVRVVLMKYI